MVTQNRPAHTQAPDIRCSFVQQFRVERRAQFRAPLRLFEKTSSDDFGGAGHSVLSFMVKRHNQAANKNFTRSKKNRTLIWPMPYLSLASVVIARRTRGESQSRSGSASRDGTDRCSLCEDQHR